MKTTTKFIIGLTVAAAAGAVIGMLLAPEKGKDLQKKIKEETGGLFDQFGKLLQAGREKIAEVEEDAMDEVQNVSKKIKKSI